MIGAHSYETICRQLASAFRQRYAGMHNVRLVGLLFARPTSRLAAEQIVPNLDYFHHRSANHVDFFCAGYGMYWEPFRENVPDMQAVARVGERDWLFSPKMFDALRQEIESEAKKWRYGGGVELILGNAVYQPEATTARIDFGSAIAVDLDKAHEDGAFVTVEHLFEDIIRYAENQDGTDPMWGLSDRMGRNIAGSALKALFIQISPEALRSEARKAFHFYVRDLAGRTESSG